MAVLKNNFEQLVRKKLGIPEMGRLPRQTELADQIGVSQTTVSRWINQEIVRFDSDMLEKMCTYLDCNVGDLIFFDFDEAS